MATAPSKRRLDALGSALRAGHTPESSGLGEVYDELMEFAAEALQDVQARVIEAIGAPVEVTARVKTLDTMREKLIRMQHLRLANMDDLIGVRIVGDMTLGGQDAMAQRLQEAFPFSWVKDRRANPVAGYRAVHVIVDLGPMHAEIQIRTQLQAAWADVFESTADRWGRGIRYGMPVEPDATGSSGARAALVALLQRLSLGNIAGAEEMRQRIDDFTLDAQLPQRWVQGLGLWVVRRSQAKQTKKLWALLQEAATLVEQIP